MNKISDLKVGDKVVTYFFGKGIVVEIQDFVTLTGTSTRSPFFEDSEIDWQKTTELNNKQMKVKEQIIIPPYGFEIDKDKSTFEKIVFKEIQNKLPMSVEEIPNRDFYINSHGTINQLAIEHSNNGLSTKERAQAFLALMQLVELRDAWNGDSERHEYFFANSSVLCFKTAQLRKQFYEQFKDLIDTAKELL